MKESDLALKFIEHFADYEVYKEVPCDGIIDIYVVMGNITTAIEVKTSFNFEVLRQAEKNRRYAHYSYIGIPAAKNIHFQKQIAKMLGVGVLTFCSMGKFEQITEHVYPGLNRKIYRPRLEPYMKNSIAGVQKEGRITAFGNSVSEIEDFLKRKGGSAHVKDIFTKENKYHWSSPSSARQCVQNYCSRGIIKSFTYKKGILTLTPEV